MLWPASMAMLIVHAAVTKERGRNPFISNKETTDCKFCNALTPEQRTQLATPSYKLKKEKREAKRVDSNPTDDTSLVDPTTVSVIGAVGNSSSAQAASAPQKRNPKRIKLQVKARSLLNLHRQNPRSHNWTKSGQNALAG